MKDKIPEWREIAEFLRKSNLTSLSYASPYEITFVVEGVRQAKKIWFDEQVKDYILISYDGSNGIGNQDWTTLLIGYKSRLTTPSTDIEYDEGEETGFSL